MKFWWPQCEAAIATLLSYSVTKDEKYLEWFEEQIKTYEDTIKVIDATEGGALIHGSEVLTLKEALDIDESGFVTTQDAVLLLKYYAVVSTGFRGSLDEYLNSDLYKNSEVYNSKE